MSRPAYSTKCVDVWHEWRDGRSGMAISYRGGEYVSWCPIAVYERDYQSLDAMSFGHALHALQEGCTVTRAAWLGHRVLSSGQFSDDSPNGDGLDYFLTRLSTGQDVPWFPSKTDALANDWQIVPKLTEE